MYSVNTKSYTQNPEWLFTEWKNYQSITYQFKVAISLNVYCYKNN